MAISTTTAIPSSPHKRLKSQFSLSSASSSPSCLPMLCSASYSIFWNEPPKDTNGFQTIAEHHHRRLCSSKHQSREANMSSNHSLTLFPFAVICIPSRGIVSQIVRDCGCSSPVLQSPTRFTNFFWSIWALGNASSSFKTQVILRLYSAEQ